MSTTFQTPNGITFLVNIKTKDALLVKDLVKYPDGRPVDIFEAAETGEIMAIHADIKTFVDVIFVLCLDQIKEYFSVTAYDEANRGTYELFPEQANEPPLTKASRWFGQMIDGTTLIAIIGAFQEAVVNFIPNENRRNSLRMVLEKHKALEALEMEYQRKTAERMFEATEKNLEKLWEAKEATVTGDLSRELAGQFGLSGNTPESSEEPTPETSHSGN